jgi:hypothetical protein
VPWWKHLVAAWFALHVLGTCEAAIPDPRFAMNKDKWKDKRVQTEFAIWAPKLGMTKKELHRTLWRFGRSAGKVHAVMDVPFKPYMWLTGNRQRWSMFAGGALDVDHYEVRGRLCDDDVACPWQRLYRTQDPEANTHAEILEFGRIRSLVSAASFNGHGTVRKRLCNAIASRFFAERPEIQIIECSFVRRRLPPPKWDAPPPSEPERGRIVTLKRGPSVSIKRGAR